MNILTRDPETVWNQEFSGVPYIGASPADLHTESYEFKNADQFLHYSGRITSLSPPRDYLYKKTSFFIDDGSDGKELSLMDFPFFKDKFVSKSDNKSLYLNQIVGFKSDLVINKPIDVVKGGIIFTEGSIKINATVKNPYLVRNSSTPNNPDEFGYLTFIAKKGISLNPPPADCHVDRLHSKMPEFHGFLVCVNGSTGKVSTSGPIHIVGGVASDKIDSLVENGGFIEWGFDPDELGPFNNDPNEIQGFYGIAMGPRDIEVVVSE
ncbi:hypothetical protein HYY75_11910 [bacterium]|nr:hypothetical protein [bacterium]